MALEPPTWVVGPPASITTTVIEPPVITPPGPSEANLMVSAHRSAGGAEPRRVIQALVAVVPPVRVEDLPTYAIEGGSICQAVRMSTTPARPGDDELIDSVYVYAMADSVEHMPDDPTPLVVRYADTTGGSPDTLPAESGDFTTPPVVSFELKLANTTAHACNSDDSMVARSWTGPNGAAGQLHPQTGADLVREASYLCRPHKAQSHGDQKDMLSADAVGMIDFCVRQYAGDTDVWLVEGRFLNATFDSAEDVHATSLKSDGQMHLEYLTVSVPGPYVIDLGPYPNPVASQGAAASTMSLVEVKANSFVVNPAHRFGFWFVIRSATPEAQQRGEDYLLSKNVAWAVGELGSTKQPIYGDNGVLTFDHGRYGTRNMLTQTSTETGWDMIRFVGENMAGTKGLYRGYGDVWTNGAEDPDNRFRPRTGMWHMAGSSGTAGPTGFSGSSPMGALIPHWGWWDRTRYMNEYGMQRVYCSARDTRDGSAAWWWRALRPDGKVGCIGDTAYVIERRRLWTQNNRGMKGTKPQVDKPGLYRAPLDRTWNKPVIAQGMDGIALNNPPNGIPAPLTATTCYIDRAIETLPRTVPSSGTLIVTSDSGTRYPFYYTSATPAGQVFFNNNTEDDKNTWFDPMPAGETFTPGIATVAVGEVDTEFDPDWVMIDDMITLGFTHTGYLRTALQDGWYCCRRYNEYRDWEELAATASRTAIPHANFSADADGKQASTNMKHGYGSVLDLSQHLAAGIPWYQTGEHYATQLPGNPASSIEGQPTWANTSHQIDQLRGYARTLQFLSGFGGICEMGLRRELVWGNQTANGSQPAFSGEAHAASGYATIPHLSGFNIPRVSSTVYRFHAFLEFVTTSAGIIGSEYAIDGSPNPYSVTPLGGVPNSGDMEQPSFGNKRGAWPHSENVFNGSNVNPTRYGSGQQSFHHAYTVATIGGIYARSFASGWFNFPLNSRCFTWMKNIFANRDAAGLWPAALGGGGAPGYDNMPYFATVRLDEYPSSITRSPTWQGGNGKTGFSLYYTTPSGVSVPRDDIAPSAPSLGQATDGSTAWTFRRASSNGPTSHQGGVTVEPPFDYYGELHKWKASGSSFYSARFFKDGTTGVYDYSYIEAQIGRVFGGNGLGTGGLQGTSKSEILDYFMRSGGPLGDSSIEGQFTKDRGGVYQYGITSVTMNMPLLAWLNNEVNP